MKVEYLLQFHKANKAGPHFDLRIKHPNRNTLYSFVIKIRSIPVCNIKGKLPKPIFIIRTYNHSPDMLESKEDILHIPKGHYGAGVLLTIERGVVDVIKWENGDIILNFSKSNVLKGKYRFKRIYSSIFSKNKEHFREIWLLKCHVNS